jgi:acyl-CoA synthetase (AMP-forming)/AMP-acid ligase II
VSAGTGTTVESTEERWVPPEPCYELTTLGLLRWGEAQYGDTDLLVTDQGLHLSYADANVESRRLAKRLVAAGVGKGTRVAGQFSYGPEWIVTWLAVTRIGAIYIPFSTAYKPRELREALRHSDSAVFLAPSVMFGEDRLEFYEEALPGLAANTNPTLCIRPAPYLRAIWIQGAPAGAAPWVTPLQITDASDAAVEDVYDALVDEIESELSPADLAIAVYTSGTTSVPNGVLHSHGALARKATSLAWYMGWEGGDRVFCGMPFFWIGGVGMTVLPAMAVGATLLCTERTHARQALDLILNENATKLTGWPAVIGPLLALAAEEGKEIPALRGNQLSVNTGGKRVSSLGMTETIASHTFVPPSKPLPEAVDPEAPHGACVGPVLAGMEHRIVDSESGADLPDGTPGVLLVRGFALTVGLIKRERDEVFTKDGWYDTGDRCYKRNGNLYLLGRIKELIKTSGNNAAPAEVESVLLELPDVWQAHVAGVPDPERGEIVAALVVPKQGCQLTAEGIRERVRPQISNYKVPRFVIFRNEEEVPWLPSGKVDRLGIKSYLAEAYGKQ